jgi:hypothetical protein
MYVTVQIFNILVLIYIESYEIYLRQINKNYTVMMFLTIVDEHIANSLPKSIYDNAADLEKSDWLKIGKDNNTFLK